MLWNKSSRFRFSGASHGRLFSVLSPLLALCARERAPSRSTHISSPARSLTPPPLHATSPASATLLHTVVPLPGQLLSSVAPFSRPIMFSLSLSEPPPPGLVASLSRGFSITPHGSRSPATPIYVACCSGRRRRGTDALRAALGRSVDTAYHPRPPRRGRSSCCPAINTAGTSHISTPRGAPLYLLLPAVPEVHPERVEVTPWTRRDSAIPKSPPPPPSARPPIHTPGRPAFGNPKRFVS